MKSQINGQPTIVKYVGANFSGIQLLKLSRCAIGYVVRGKRNIYYGDKFHIKLKIFTTLFTITL